MEDNNNIIETLFERIISYIKTSYELIKLKTLDKFADSVSTFITRFVVIVFFASCLLFLNIGIAFLIGDLFGKIYYGFFVISFVYGLLSIFIIVFMPRWLKKIIFNFIIKQVLK